MTAAKNALNAFVVHERRLGIDKGVHKLELKSCSIVILTAPLLRLFRITFIIFLHPRRNLKKKDVSGKRDAKKRSLFNLFANIRGVVNKFVASHISSTAT